MSDRPTNNIPNHLERFFSLCVGVCALVLCLCTACEPDTACQNREMETHAVITLSADSTDLSGTLHTYDAWDSLHIQGIGANTLLYSPTPLKQITLSLRPDTSETAWLMLYHGRLDTLIITHTPRIQYVSLACGCAVYHTITGARSTDPRVDSVSVINASVETTAQENLRIYLHE